MSEANRIVRIDVVLARSSLSRSTIYRKISDGTFPPPVKLGTRGAGWQESKLDRWIADPPGWRPLD
ncbi:helix-turn-helix transcriptional regulator [Brevundimonas diminuta]|uniref:helix-turn-helix transcriptional regulator n=1 Tax=Brevundimonas diminuta TaxID=293 RepID=UPI0030F81111